jgi:hypothetical protein
VPSKSTHADRRSGVHSATNRFKEPDQYPWQSAHSPNLRLEGASFPGSNFDCAPQYFSA